MGTSIDCCPTPIHVGKISHKGVVHPRPSSSHRGGARLDGDVGHDRGEPPRVTTIASPLRNRACWLGWSKTGAVGHCGRRMPRRATSATGTNAPRPVPVKQRCGSPRRSWRGASVLAEGYTILEGERGRERRPIHGAESPAEKPRPPGSPRHAGIPMKKATALRWPRNVGGVDGTRTRDPRRDRPVF